MEGKWYHSPVAVLLLIAGLFLTTGTLHFLRPDLFLKIVPPRLPWPLGLVYLTPLHYNSHILYNVV